MAYGQNNGPSNNNQVRGFVKKPTPNAASVTATAAVQGQAGGDGAPTTKGPSNKLFAAFKNKGQGYSVMTKEDIVIPAGTRVGIFEDTIKGKDGTEYQVLSVTKLKDREQA